MNTEKQQDKRQKPEEENRATLSALVTLCSGIALNFLSFALSKEHIVADSALWYFSQCLIYAGGIFSIKEYALGEIRKHLRK